jgi:hypothetical protein
MHIYLGKDVKKFPKFKQKWLNEIEKTIKFQVIFPQKIFFKIVSCEMGILFGAL